MGSYTSCISSVYDLNLKFLWKSFFQGQLVFLSSPSIPLGTPPAPCSLLPAEFYSEFLQGMADAFSSPPSHHLAQHTCVGSASGMHGPWSGGGKVKGFGPQSVMPRPWEVSFQPDITALLGSEPICAACTCAMAWNVSWFLLTGAQTSAANRGGHWTLQTMCPAGDVGQGAAATRLSPNPRVLRKVSENTIQEHWRSLSTWWEEVSSSLCLGKLHGIMLL